LLAAALAWVRVPLRVVAPCEVVPRHPVVVTAPVDGVLAEVLARPGDVVAEGERLAVYEEDAVREEMNVLRRQVEMAEADLESSRALALDDRRARAELRLLENRLAQERVRLAAFEARVERMAVSAPVGGTVLMGDPALWRGRPVATGERILTLVDPADTRVRIWLPQNDRIDFDFGRPARILLHAHGGGAHAARLSYVAEVAQASPEGESAFPAEAEWMSPPGWSVLGLRGTAVLYGERVSLGYFLFRKPLAAVRRWIGW